ncbi:MAG: ABC transporter permease [Bacteroidetes bacterium]|nr:ABC transporter permease [Bacteroidota bacterium]
MTKPQASAFIHITPKHYGLLSIREIWSFRELFYYFAWRDIKIRYKQTFLGVAWALLQPLIQMFLFAFVVAAIRGGNSSEVNGMPYEIFLLCGLLLWNAFSAGLSNAAGSLNQNAAMLKKIYFPKLILPFSAVIVSFFDLLMSLLVFAGALIYFQVVPSWIILAMLPLSILITFLATTGLGMLLGALSVKYRDVRYIIPFGIQMLFWISPVVYSAEWLNHHWLGTVLLANPMTGAIQLLRDSIASSAVNWQLLGITLGICLGWFILGIVYFKRTEYYFADIA